MRKHAQQDLPVVDVVVVGAGPNGLAAAVTAARAGLSVLVLERSATIGGAARTAELTLTGFRHDVGSAVHPMAVASPFFRRFGLTRRVPLITPAISYAHPLPDGAAIAYRDLRRTAAELGADGPAWQRLLGPLVERERQVARFTTGPVLRVPPDPAVAVRFGMRVLEQGGPLWNARWRTEAAPALLTGVLAHAIAPLPGAGPAAAGLALAVMAHAGGWPVPRGGSQAIVDALTADLVAHGGRIETRSAVHAYGELPPHRAVLFDTSVPVLLAITGDRLTPLLAARLRRFPFGGGAAKLDLALDGPVPWRDPRLRDAVTVHLGGTRAEITAAERQAAAGRTPDRPYVLVAQPSVVDPTRAPAGKHVLWAYTHVPNGSTADPAESILDALEREAPGIRDLVLAQVATPARALAAEDPNLGGGDIAAGSTRVLHLVARPRVALDPWFLGDGMYLCSASAPPGPGVHGMGGYLAARSMLRRQFGVLVPPPLDDRPAGDRQA